MAMFSEDWNGNAAFGQVSITVNEINF